MKVLVYTAPTRGHLFPVVPIMTELQRRGHEVVVRTIASEVPTLSGMGFKASEVDPAIVACSIGDYEHRNPVKSLKAGVVNFIDRGRLQIPEVQRLLDEERPDAMLIDFLCWGAMAVAEAWGGPWAAVQHSASPLPDPDVPPFGPGFRPMAGPIGRLRNRALTPLTLGVLERAALPGGNALRKSIGVRPLASAVDMFTSPPLTIYLTSPAIEYPRRAWPESYCLTGPLTWDPPYAEPSWLAAVQGPLALVTTSSEFQDDGELVRAALRGLASSDLEVVATMPTGVEQMDVPANAHLEEFVPHSLVLPRAEVAIVHGGFGVTQKALAAGVPVVVVPFGRDQAEVGRRAEAAGAAVLLPRKRLSPRRVGEAVARARTLRPAARRLAARLAAEDGAALAADRLEALVVTW